MRDKTGSIIFGPFEAIDSHGIEFGEMICMKDPARTVGNVVVSYWYSPKMHKPVKVLAA